jgi:hypothetical protein
MSAYSSSEVAAFLITLRKAAAMGILLNLSQYQHISNTLLRRK